MYFWRIERLKEEMRAGPVAPGDVLGYVLGFVLLRALLQFPSRLFKLPETPSVNVAIWPQFVLIGLFVVLLWTAYRANGGPAGRDLAGRLLALHWVLGLRFMLGFFVVLGFALIPLTVAVGLSPTSLESMNGQLVVLALIVGFQLLFYWRLVHHLRGVQVVPTEAG